MTSEAETKSKYQIDRDSEKPIRSYPLKRVSDILVSLFLLPPTAIIYLFVALMIKITDPHGPVIFKQRRVGKNGREFDFYKFRSMAVNNDDSRHKEYIKHFIDGNEEELKRIQGEAEIYKLADDNRVTPIGKFLRKTSLDELPQLINVLRGDMSMVGPRPHLPYEVEMYKPWHRRRLSGTPGITGIWQLYGRSKVPFDESVSMDIWYLEHQSLKLDLEIIFRTFVKIFGDEGAC